MKVKFDNTIINSDYIIGVSQVSKLFDDTFKLGATLCRQINMTVSNDVNTTPSLVYIYDDNNNLQFTLQVYSVFENDDQTINYTLTDAMINANRLYQIDNDATPTVGDIVEDICDIIGCDAPSDTYYADDMVVSWTGNEYYTARQFLSNVAELNGGYARISASNELEFVTLSNTVKKAISLDVCDSFKLGEYHKYSNVKYDNGIVVEEYGSTTNETYLLNTDNILFSDVDTTYNIANMVQHIGTLFNGYEFNCIEVKNSETDESLQAGDCITIDGYKTIAQIDWRYYGGWSGGYSLLLTNIKQQETQVVDTNEKVKSLSTKIDREINAITAEFTNYVKNDDDEYINVVTSVRQSGNGIEVGKSTSETKVQITNESVDIVSGGEITQSMQKGQFVTGEWVIGQYNNAQGLAIFRRHN